MAFTASHKPLGLFYSLAAGFGLMAVTHSTASEPVFVFTDSSEWVLSPQIVVENSTSALQVGHPRYTCASSFEPMQVTVQDGRISLGFTSTSNPAIRCPVPVSPIGPRFNLPPLKAGSYQVWITDAPACVWTQGCKIGVIEEWAGVLTVGHNTSGHDFTFGPTSVEEKVAFDLQVLSHSYSCDVGYDSLSYVVRNQTIALQFTPVKLPDRVCPAVYRPYGPRFKIEGLPAGQYRILVQPNKPCLDPLGCPASAVMQDIGALTVTPTLPTRDMAFTPTQARVGAPLTLNLVSRDFGCGIVVSEKHVTIADQTVTLHFKAAYDPAMACPTLSTFSTPFSLPAMREGVYKVVLDPADGCPSELPLCDAYHLARTGQSLVIANIPTALRARPGAKRSGDRVAIDKGAPAEVIWILPSGSSAVNAAGRHLP